MIIGYNTNGFAFHRLEGAIDIISELGYGCVALTVDHHVLNPYDSDIADQVERTKSQLGSLGLASVIETGARFLLDPRRKHQPTLLDRRTAGRDRRAEFLRRCIDIAAGVGASAVSFWSGAMPPGQEEAVAFGLLAESCRELAGYAAERDVALAFEPEPGMLVDTLAGYQRLAAAVDHDAFRLTIDVGHLQCSEPDSPPMLIERFGDRLANVHLDDMRRGVHDHLFFGEGEVDFASVFRALDRARFDGPACVELSRHSHNAVEVARHAKAFIDRVHTAN
jgi:sugar phosphate isomerase/epimerase